MQQKLKVHLIGIGGIGVSALGRWFLSQGYVVSGSDIENSPIIQELRKEGAKISIGHKAQNVSKSTELVIYSAAVNKDNSEIKTAKKINARLRSYAEALGDLNLIYKTIAIAGAHGKSTSTALLSLILIKAGFDPTVIIGTKLREFGNKNFRSGRSPYLIIEADEYHKSFLNYSPFAAIITNIDKEHLDFFKNLEEIKKTFLKFIENIKSSGILVVNRDNRNLLSLKPKIERIVKRNHLKLFWYSINANQRLVRRISSSLKISGKHNISNALGVYTLAKALGVKGKDIFNVFRAYRESWRRMEYRGNLIVSSQYPVASKRNKNKLQVTSYKLPVYDDYAHHPTEIKATLSGIAQKWPKKGVICVFQPHQAKRLALLLPAFIKAFDDANILILLDIYKVAGREVPALSNAEVPALSRAEVPALSRAELSQNIDSSDLAEAIQRRISKNKNIHLKQVLYLPYPQRLKPLIKDILRRSALSPRQSAIVVMMGAGDIYKMTDNLLR